MLCTLIFVALVGRMLAKKGTSPKLKRLVCYRHFVYMVLYLLMLNNALYPLIGQAQDESYDPTFIWKGAIIDLICGVGIAFLRLREPYIFNELLRVCRIKRKRQRDKLGDNYSEESLNSFLNSAYNIEFVSVILKGMNKHMKNLARKGVDGMAINTDDPFAEVSVEGVDFNDIEKWQVDRVETESKSIFSKHFSTSKYLKQTTVSS